MPENQIGADVEERMGSDFGMSMGTTEAGSRFGKWELRGVLGGGSKRENSGARVLGMVLLAERVKAGLVFLARRSISDWPVMSAANSDDIVAWLASHVGP